MGEFQRPALRRSRSPCRNSRTPGDRPRRLLGLPIACATLRAKPPRSTDQDVGGLRRSLHGADDLRVRWQRLIARGSEGLRRRMPGAALRMRPACVQASAARQAPSASLNWRSPSRASAINGIAPCLQASRGWTLSATICRPLGAEQCRRARREVLQTRAQRQNHIGVRGQRIGGGGPGHADARRDSAD